jgi:hypothetical protein
MVSGIAFVIVSILATVGFFQVHGVAPFGGLLQRIGLSVAPHREEASPRPVGCGIHYQTVEKIALKRCKTGNKEGVFRTWITRCCRTIPWPAQKDGPPTCRRRDTRLTMLLITHYSLLITHYSLLITEFLLRHESFPLFSQ